MPARSSLPSPSSIFSGAAVSVKLEATTHKDPLRAASALPETGRLFRCLPDNSIC